MVTRMVTRMAQILKWFVLMRTVTHSDFKRLARGEHHPGHGVRVKCGRICGR